MMSSILQVILRLARGDAILGQRRAEILHHQRRLCLVLESGVNGDTELGWRAMGTYSGRCLTSRLGPGPPTCSVGAYASVLVRVGGDVRHKLLGSEGEQPLSAHRKG